MNQLYYLIQVITDPANKIDPIVADNEEAEAVEDHLHGMGWDARRVEEEELEKMVA